MSQELRAVCDELGIDYVAGKDGEPTLACYHAIETAICMGALKRLAPMVAATADDRFAADFTYLAEVFGRNTKLAWDHQYKLIEGDLSQRLATWEGARKRRKFTDADYDREESQATSKKDLARRLGVHPTNLSKYEAKRSRKKS